MLVNKAPGIASKKGPRIFRNQAGWRQIGDRRIYFRSMWEAKYAGYLEFLKGNQQIADWEYEPKTFWFDGIKRGTCSYKPDFRVVRNDRTHYWVEVKGYMDSCSRTKIKRFEKYFPNEELIVLEKKWFSLTAKNFSPISVKQDTDSSKEKSE